MFGDAILRVECAQDIYYLIPCHWEQHDGCFSVDNALYSGISHIHSCKNKYFEEDVRELKVQGRRGAMAEQYFLPLKGQLISEANR